MTSIILMSVAFFIAAWLGYYIGWREGMKNMSITLSALHAYGYLKFPSKPGTLEKQSNESTGP